MDAEIINHAHPQSGDHIKILSIEVKDLVDEQKDFVRLYSTGAIELNLPQYVEAFCTIKVHMFPFDTQFCTIAMTTNQLVLTELNVSLTPPKFAKFRFMGNSEWELHNVSMVYHELTDSGIWGVPSLESNSKAYALRELIEEQKKMMKESNKGQLEQENEDEWDRIENKLDFFWIFFFEALNIANLVFLMINVSTPPPTIDDWLYGKNPVELFSY
uniref:Neurotransmitter-gated ion-channel ligand-binding domain-containing protein n=1 Tax=Acrobeloides nanus TaxID=290746 RepID=A0A914DQF1_9BILA